MSEAMLKLVCWLYFQVVAGLTFHGVGWWERARWVRTEQQNVRRSRLGAKPMIHSCKNEKTEKTKKNKKAQKKQEKERNQKKQKKQENQEDLLGQSASDIGLLLFLWFLFFWFLSAVLHAPREGCRELSLVICLQFCMPQGKDAESWVLSFACFLVSQCICQNRECAKRNAKSALWWFPVLKKTPCLSNIFSPSSAQVPPMVWLTTAPFPSCWSTMGSPIILHQLPILWAWLTSR